MNFLTKVLLMPVANRPVEKNSLPKFKDVLESDLKIKRAHIALELSDAFLERLVQEAYWRASNKDPEYIAKNGEMYRQIESISNIVYLICNGGQNIDASLEKIIDYYTSDP